MEQFATRSSFEQTGKRLYYYSFGFFFGKLEGKILFRRRGRGWKNTIKMDLRDIGYEGTNWLKLSQDCVQWRVLINTVTNSGSRKMWVIS